MRPCNFSCARLTAQAFVGDKVGESHGCGGMCASNEIAVWFSLKYLVAVVVRLGISSRLNYGGGLKFLGGTSALALAKQLFE